MTLHNANQYKLLLYITPIKMQRTVFVYHTIPYHTCQFLNSKMGLYYKNDFCRATCTLSWVGIIFVEMLSVISFNAGLGSVVYIQSLPCDLCGGQFGLSVHKPTRIRMRLMSKIVWCLWWSDSHHSYIIPWPLGTWQTDHGGCRVNKVKYECKVANPKMLSSYYYLHIFAYNC